MNSTTGPMRANAARQIRVPRNTCRETWLGMTILTTTATGVTTASTDTSGIQTECLLNGRRPGKATGIGSAPLGMDLGG